MSPFVRLAHAVLGGSISDDALFAVVTCYFDEAIESWKDSFGKPRRFTFVCGYVASFGRWKEFEKEWRTFLDGYEILDFHMTDYCSCSGEYRKWKGAEFEPIRQQFMENASAVVRKFVRYGFVAGMTDSIFLDVNRRYMLEETFGSPYGLVGRLCSELAQERRMKFYPNERGLDFVFEDGGPDKQGLMRGMTSLVPAFPDPIFRPGKSQKPSHKYPDGREAVLPLQAADYLAYEIRKLFSDQIKVTPIRAPRLSFRALTPIPTAKILLATDGLEEYCARVGIGQRESS